MRKLRSEPRDMISKITIGISGTLTLRVKTGVAYKSPGMTGYKIESYENISDYWKVRLGVK